MVVVYLIFGARAMPSKQSTNTVLITCDVVVELIGEVQQNGLASRTLAP